jgi:hypothetical protein
MTDLQLGLAIGAGLGCITTLFLGLVAVSVTEWRRDRNPWRNVERRGDE